jgi:two-component sensor histidine kinase
VEEEPRYVNLYPNQLPTRSELSVPLCSRDQILGVLDVQSPERNAFSENDVLVIETVAQQIAIAMENARLYEQARRDSEIKTTLLQEVHHRVKNNLQIISSLLDLQADARNDPLVLQALEDSRHRVRAMALVHETLYQSEDLARLDLAAYLQNLADYLVDAYDGFTSDITLQLQVDSVPLGLDRAVPCGLMISELVTNALKHAFPDGGPGEIQIAAHLQGEQVELIVRDDGVGLPADIDPETSTSLGLRLVHLLIRQLQGNLCIDRKHGTAFKILFKVPTPRSTNDGNSADSRR